MEGTTPAVRSGCSMPIERDQPRTMPQSVARCLQDREEWGARWANKSTSEAWLLT
jgi:hypothetical protein